MARGFALSLEAAASLVMLAAIITVQLDAPDYGKNSLHSLALLQKENDLLKIWAKQQKFSPEEMRSDFEFAFPDLGGEISVNEKTIGIGKKTGNSVSSEMSFFDSEMREIKVSVKVFE